MIPSKNLLCLVPMLKMRICGAHSVIALECEIVGLSISLQRYSCSKNVVLHRERFFDVSALEYYARQIELIS